MGGQWPKSLDATGRPRINGKMDPDRGLSDFVSGMLTVCVPVLL